MKLSSLTTAVPDAASQKQLAKAWVSFTTSGTDGSIVGISGTPYNVQSVVRTISGNSSYYTITFTNPMSDANYAVLTSGGGGTGAPGGSSPFAAFNNIILSFSQTTTSFQIGITNGNAIIQKPGGVWSIVVFGN